MITFHFPDCVLRTSLSPYDMVILVAWIISHIHLHKYSAFCKAQFPPFYKVTLYFVFSLALNKWGWLPTHPAPDELDLE